MVSGRQHPIKLFSYTTKYFWLLAIPLLRGIYSLLSNGGSWQAWFRGAWLDLIVVAVIFAFAWLRWSCVGYEFDDKSVTIKKGLLVSVSDQVFYSKITTVSINQNVLYRMFGACEVQISTNAGVLNKADVSIVMKKTDAEKFYYSVKAARVKSLNYTVPPNRLKLLLFSFLFSSSFSGILICIALLLEVSSVIDQRTEAQLILDAFTDTVNKAAVYVPPILAGIALVLGITWVLSFIHNIFSFWNSSLTKSSDSVYVKSGFIMKRINLITLDKINFIDFNQNLLARLFRISSLSVHAAGFGKTGQKEMSVVMPITSNKEMRSTIKEVFPEYPAPKIQLKSDIKSYNGFYAWPIIFAALPIVGFWLLKHFMPDWYTIASPALIVSLIPAAWLAVVKTASLFTTGIGFKDKYLCMRYSRYFGFHTVIMPKERIAKVVLRQSPFQVLNGTCTLRVFSASQARRVHTIRGLNIDRAMNLFDRNGVDLYFSEHP